MRRCLRITANAAGRRAAIRLVFDESLHRESIPLNEAQAPQRFRLARVLDQEPDVLRHLTRLGLIPDTAIQVVEVLPFDGQMTLLIDDVEATVSRTLASRLLVTPA